MHLIIWRITNVCFSSRNAGFLLLYWYKNRASSTIPTFHTLPLVPQNPSPPFQIRNIPPRTELANVKSLPVRLTVTIHFHLLKPPVRPASPNREDPDHLHHVDVRCPAQVGGGADRLDKAVSERCKDGPDKHKSNGLTVYPGHFCRQLWWWANGRSHDL